MITIDSELFLDSYLGIIVELIEAQKEAALRLTTITGIDIAKNDIVLGELTLFEKAVMLAHGKEFFDAPLLKDQVSIRASIRRRKTLQQIFQNSIDYRMKENAFLGQIFIRNDMKIVHKQEDDIPLIDFSIFQNKE